MQQDPKKAKYKEALGLLMNDPDFTSAGQDEKVEMLNSFYDEISSGYLRSMGQSDEEIQRLKPKFIDNMLNQGQKAQKKNSTSQVDEPISTDFIDPISASNRTATDLNQPKKKEPTASDNGYAERARKLRTTSRKNPDGSRSTVLMESAEWDGKHYVYPTLYPKDSKNYTEDPKDWFEVTGREAQDEAIKRGELFEFDTKEEAEAFAKGSWKPGEIKKRKLEEINKRATDYLQQQSPEFNQQDENLNYAEQIFSGEVKLLTEDEKMSDRVRERQEDIIRAFKESDTWRDDGHLPTLPKNYSPEYPEYIEALHNRVKGLNASDPKTTSEWLSRNMNPNIVERATDQAKQQMVTELRESTIRETEKLAEQEEAYLGTMTMNLAKLEAEYNALKDFIEGTEGSDLQKKEAQKQIDDIILPNQQQLLKQINDSYETIYELNNIRYDVDNDLQGSLETAVKSFYNNSVGNLPRMLGSAFSAVDALAQAPSRYIADAILDSDTEVPATLKGLAAMKKLQLEQQDVATEAMYDLMSQATNAISLKEDRENPLASQTGQAFGQLAQMTAGSALGGPVIGYAIGGALSADEMMQEGVNSGLEFKDAALMAGLYAPLGSILEYYGAGRGIAALEKRSLRKYIVDQVIKGRVPLEKRSIARALGDYMKENTKQTLDEAITEGTQYMLQDLMQRGYNYMKEDGKQGYNNPSIFTEEYMDALGENVGGGAYAGFLMQAVTGLMGVKRRNFMVFKDQLVNDNSYDRIKRQLNLQMEKNLASESERARVLAQLDAAKAIAATTPTTYPEEAQMEYFNIMMQKAAIDRERENMAPGVRKEVFKFQEAALNGRLEELDRTYSMKNRNIKSEIEEVEEKEAQKAEKKAKRKEKEKESGSTPVPEQKGIEKLAAKQREEEQERRAERIVQTEDPEEAVATSAEYLQSDANITTEAIEENKKKNGKKKKNRRPESVDEMRSAIEVAIQFSPTVQAMQGAFIDAVKANPNMLNAHTGKFMKQFNEQYETIQRETSTAIAEEYLREQETPSDLSAVEQAIWSTLGKVDPGQLTEDLIHPDELKAQKGNIQKSWTKKGATKIDQAAMNASMALKGMDTDIDSVTPEDIGAFMLRFPTGRTRSARQKELSNLHEQLTGSAMTIRSARQRLEKAKKNSDFEKTNKKAKEIKSDDVKAINELLADPASYEYFNRFVDDNDVVDWIEMDRNIDDLLASFVFGDLTAEQKESLKQYVNEQAKKQKETGRSPDLEASNIQKLRQEREDREISEQFQQDEVDQEEDDLAFQRQQKAREIIKAGRKGVLDFAKRSVEVLKEALGINVVMDQVGFDKAVAAYKQKTGLDASDANGFMLNGTVFLNPSRINKDTAAHEFAHVYLAHMAKNHRALFDKGVALIKQTKYFTDVQKNPAYANITEIEQAEEALAQAIGERSADKLLFRMGSMSMKNKFMSWLNEMKKWLNETFFMDYSGEIDAMTIDEFLDGSVHDLLGGKKIVDPKGMFAVRFQKDPGQWFSNTLKSLSSIQQKKATPEQWVNMLVKNGVKGTKAEIDWIGLQDYLSDVVKRTGQKSISKDQVEKFVKANKIKINTVGYNPDPDFDKLTHTFDRDGSVSIYMADYEMDDSPIYEIYEEDGLWSVYNEFTGTEFNRFKSKEAALDAVKRDFIAEGIVTERTRYEQYIVPGDYDKYQEVRMIFSNYDEVAVDPQIKILEQELNDVKDLLTEKIEQVENDWLAEQARKQGIDTIKNVDAVYMYKWGTSTGEIEMFAQRGTEQEKAIRAKEATVDQKATTDTFPNVVTSVELANEYMQLLTSPEITDLEDRARDIGNELQKLKTDPSNQSYKHRHWIGDINVLAHLRTTDRETVDGKKVLFLDEIQSDWSQTGKKKGFVADYKKNVAEKQAEIDSLKSKLLDELHEIEKKHGYKFVEEFNVLAPGITVSSQIRKFRYGLAETEKLKELKAKRDNPKNSLDEMMDAFDKLREYKDTQRNDIEKASKLGTQLNNAISDLRNLKIWANQLVPNSPYPKTDQWIGLAFRQALKMASEGNYDSIAWATGEQNADIYNLRKQVSSIGYNKLIDGRYDMLVKDLTGNTILNRTVREDQLEEYFGKEAAEKIIANEYGTDKPGDGYETLVWKEQGYVNQGVIEGENLEMGGHGMKDFYNNVLPKAVAKELKRYDNKNKIIPFKIIASDVRTQYIYANENEVQKYLNDGWELTGRRDDDFGTVEVVKSPFATQQYGVEITPKIKESMQSGTPLFQKGFKNEQEIIAIAQQLEKEGFSREEIQSALEAEGYTSAEVNRALGLGKVVGDDISAAFDLDPDVEVEFTGPVPDADPIKKVAKALAKSFPGVKTVFKLNAFQEALKADGIEYNGQRVHIGADGTIYFNPATMDAYTPFRAFARVWIYAARKGNPGIQAQLRSIIEGTGYLKDAKARGEADPYTAAMADAIADTSMDMARQPQGFRKRFKRFVNSVFNAYIKPLIAAGGWHGKVNAKEIFNMTLADFTQRVAEELTLNKKLSPDMLAAWRGEAHSEAAQRAFVRAKTGNDFNIIRQGVEAALLKGAQRDAIANLIHNKFGYDLKTAAEMIDEVANEMQVKGTEPIIPIGNKDWYKTFMDFRMNYQDQDIWLKKVQQAITKVSGFIPDHMNAYVLRELKNSKINQQIEDLKEYIYGPDRGKMLQMTGRTNTYDKKKVRDNSLAYRMAQEGLTLKDLSLYLFAKHAPERNARILEETTRNQAARIAQLEKMLEEETNEERQELIREEIEKVRNNLDTRYAIKENGARMNDETAMEIIEKFEADGKSEALETFAKEFRENVIQKRLDILYEGGRISWEQYSALTSGVKQNNTVVWENYIPVKIDETFFETRRGGNQGGAAIQAATGKGNFEQWQVVDIVNRAVMDLGQAIQFNENNKANQALLELAESNPDPTLWKIHKEKGLGTKYNELTGEMEEYNSLVPTDVKNNSVKVIVDGKTLYVELKHDGLRDGFLQDVTVGRFWKTMSKIWRPITQFRRSTLTVLNPFFAFTNYARDIQDALANVGLDAEKYNLKGVRLQVIKNMPKSMAAIARNYFAGAENGEFTEYLIEAHNAGMKMSWANYGDMQKQLERLQEISEQMQEDERVLHNPLEWVQAFQDTVLGVNEIAEMSTRLSVYVALRKKGVTPQQAASAAKNVTLNFEKKGKKMGMLNQFYLFLNAGVQGVAKTSQLLKTNEGRKTLGAFVAAGFINKALLHAFMDEEDEMRLMRLGSSDWSQNTYIFNPFNPKMPITIPKPYSFIRFAMNFGENTYDVASGRKTMFRAFADDLQSLQMVVDPITGNTKNWVSAMFPELFSQAAEISMGRNYMNAPIYPKWMEDAPDHKQYYDNTHSFYKETAQDLYDLTKDSGVPPVSISPETMNYMVEEVFGGVIRELSNVALYSTADEAFPLDKKPLIRRFVTDISKDEKMVRRFLYSTVEQMRSGQKVTEKQLRALHQSYQLAFQNQLLGTRSLDIIADQALESNGIYLIMPTYEEAISKGQEINQAYRELEQRQQ